MSKKYKYKYKYKPLKRCQVRYKNDAGTKCLYSEHHHLGSERCFLWNSQVKKSIVHAKIKKVVELSFKWVPCVRTHLSYIGIYYRDGKNSCGTRDVGVRLTFSLGPSYRMGRVYKWNWTMYVCMCVCPSVITSKMIIIPARRLHRPL